MSKHRANNHAKKNNQVNNRQSTMDKDTQKKSGRKGTLAHTDVDDDQIGNFDVGRSKGYQASSGRMQNQDVDMQQTGNRPQNQNYDRSVQGAGRNAGQDDTISERLSSNERWPNDQSMSSSSSVNRQSPSAGSFKAGSKDTQDKDSRSAGKGEKNTRSERR